MDIPDLTSVPTMEEVEEEKERLEYQKHYRRTLRNIIYALIAAAVAAVLLTTLFFPVRQVSGSGMEPTLFDSDIVLLERNGNFDTGDLVGFYYQDNFMLKRVIGMPGDVIDMDSDGNVKVNGEDIDEPYLAAGAFGECDIDLPYQVPENSYFLMGDNRITSIDSRSSSIGCIEADRIVGKVVWRVWPLKSISLIR